MGLYCLATSMENGYHQGALDSLEHWKIFFFLVPIQATMLPVAFDLISDVK